MVAMRRGLFGGTFDPIHFGHIHAISHAIDRAHLDTIQVVVAGDPYQKNDLVAGSLQRLQWVKIAVEEFYGGKENVIVDDREIRRDGPSYTYDTVLEMKAEFPEDELVLVVGEDIIDTITTWKESEKLKSLVEIFIVPRTIFSTSSTYIRTQLRQKRPITGLIPSRIESEINKKSLYN